MGYCLLFENMLPSVLKVRDACLNDKGILIPSHASIWIAGFSKTSVIEEVDLSSINNASKTSVITEICDKEWLVTKHQRILLLNLGDYRFS
jgi:hypothetical protein